MMIDGYMCPFPVQLPSNELQHLDPSGSLKRRQVGRFFVDSALDGFARNFQGRNHQYVWFKFKKSLEWNEWTGMFLPNHQF
jgi:hypothetical protein